MQIPSIYLDASIMNSSIGIVIPTFRAAQHLPHCLPPLLQSPLKPRILIIDSSSPDQTVDIAQKMGAETLVIPQVEFNHGTTREKGRQYLHTSIVVMMTQDAYLVSSDMLEELVKPIFQKKASIAYARQIPHRDAGFFGSFARSFNYPPKSHIRSISDIATYGVYTFFCSDSCAAYCNSALNDVGGFPHVLFGEDTVVTAKLLHKQHHIAYVAEAQVYHSHDYTLKQEFCRHFDIGLARSAYQELISLGGSDHQRGKDYTQALLKTLWQTSPSLIPYALLQTATKYFGYNLGQASLNAPLWLKKMLSSQKYYWNSSMISSNSKN
jgi:rhamnosyltransferase